MVTDFINAVLEYFKHDSTWRGVIFALTTLGVTISPELQASVIQLGLAAAAFFEVFVADRNVQK